MIDYLPSIAQQILDTAWSQLEDADYENHARVIIGNDMVLVDKDEFEELKAVVTNDRDLQDFTEIVPLTKEEEANRHPQSKKRKK